MGNNNIVNIFRKAKTTDIQHTFSTHNVEHINKSQFCGCFNCCTVFRASEINTYCFVEDDFDDDGNLLATNETTGECPNCSSSTILPDSVVDVTPRLIMTMYEEWMDDAEETEDLSVADSAPDQDPDVACDNCAEAYGTERCIDCENYDGDTGDPDPDADDNEEEDPED
jgi:hypothetical protein